MSETSFLPEAKFMHAAIDLAAQCDPVEHPVGAVVVKDSEIISSASNQAHHDPTFHAERLAISEAQRTLNSKYLEDCQMYSTLQPCTLFCAGPILVSRLAAVVYGANTADAQQYTRTNPSNTWMTNEITLEEYSERTPWSRTQIIGGFLRDECLELFKRTPRSAEYTATPDARKVRVINVKALESELVQAQFMVGDQRYDSQEVPLTAEKFLAWLPSYADKAPDCAHCQRLIFPTQQVAQGTLVSGAAGQFHLECSGDAAGFAGWFDWNAKFIPAFTP